MSIESKHAYRFGYLKSQQWEAVRLEALVREKGRCQICDKESLSNDAHHVWYPENIFETTSKHLAILCRPCHVFLHGVMPECKTNDKKTGLEHWGKYQRMIRLWRMEKASIFEDGNVFRFARELRDAYKELKRDQQVLIRWIMENSPQSDPDTVEETLGKWKLDLSVMEIIRKSLGGIDP